MFCCPNPEEPVVCSPGNQSAMPTRVPVSQPESEIPNLRKYKEQDLITTRSIWIKRTTTKSKLYVQNRGIKQDYLTDNTYAVIGRKPSIIDTHMEHIVLLWFVLWYCSSMFFWYFVILFRFSLSFDCCSVLYENKYIHLIFVFAIPDHLYESILNSYTAYF